MKATKQYIQALRSYYSTCPTSETDAARKSRAIRVAERALRKSGMSAEAIERIAVRVERGPRKRKVCKSLAQVVKALAFDHPKIQALKKRIIALEEQGLVFDHPKIMALRDRIISLQTATPISKFNERRWADDARYEALVKFPNSALKNWITVHGRGLAFSKSEAQEIVAQAKAMPSYTGAKFLVRKIREV